MTQIDPEYDGTLNLSPYHLLSNVMFSKTRSAGFPVELLFIFGENASSIKSIQIKTWLWFSYGMMFVMEIS